MKLKASAQKDVQILTASEGINPKDLAVLKAGIGSFFKNGKNKIVLELHNAQGIASEILRELAVLDITARELSGRIVLAGVSPELEKQIKAFAKPPVIPCYSSVADAIKAFEPPAPKPAAAPAAAPGAAPAPAAPSGALDEGGKVTDPKQDEVQLLKEQIRTREQGELGQLRKKLTSLESENKTLREQLLAMVVERKDPVDTAGFMERIKKLETELEQLMNAAEGAKPGAGPGGAPAKA